MAKISCQKKKQKTFFDYLKASLKDITIIILLLATIVSTYLAYHSGETYIEPMVIFSVVVLNIILSIRQNYQADKSMNELNNFSVPSAKVIRENEYQNIPSKEIVVGDLLVIERGDRISADAILIDASNLQMEESILTGESLASEKINITNRMKLTIYPIVKIKYFLAHWSPMAQD